MATERRGVRHSPEALRACREARDLSQEQLAQMAGCSQCYLSQLELGDRWPSPRMLLRLADALGCTVTDLIPRQRAAS
jgi:transcriptional regulator with XRE-family HTH domain